jgi:hypothetical protein
MDYRRELCLCCALQQMALLTGFVCKQELFRLIYTPVHARFE